MVSMGIKKTRNRIERWFRKLKKEQRDSTTIQTQTIKESRRDSQINSNTTQHNNTDQSPRSGNTNLMASF